MICRAFDPPLAFFFCAPALLLSTVDHSPSGLGSSFGEALRAEPRSARSARAARQPRTAQRSAGRGIGERLVWEENSPKKNRCYKSRRLPKPQTPPPGNDRRRDAAHPRQLRPANQGSLAACGMQPVPVLAIFLHFALPAGRGRHRAAENASRRRADERLGRRAGLREGRVRARGPQGDGGCNRLPGGLRCEEEQRQGPQREDELGRQEDRQDGAGAAGSNARGGQAQDRRGRLLQPREARGAERRGEGRREESGQEIEASSYEGHDGADQDDCEALEGLALHHWTQSRLSVIWQAAHRLCLLCE